MSRRNYWTALRQRKISRRTMLGASAKAGVGAAGLALVGCGDDDEPAAVDTSAIAAAAGDAAAAAEAASDAAEAAGRAAEAAEAASALAAEAAESDDAEQAAAAAQAAADAAADAAAAARAAGDAGAAAVAQAAADAASAAAQAAREVGAEDTAAAAAAAQAAADAAAVAATAAEEAADAARGAVEAVAAVAGGMAEDAEFTVPWPLDQVDLDASIVNAVAADRGGLDQMRAGSFGNYHSHGAVFGTAMDVDPRDGSAIPSLAAPEWIDPVTIRASVVPAPFHDGSILTAHDVVFSYDRMGGLAEYHQGGETTDHPGSWAPANPGPSAHDWVRNEAVDDRTWSFELPAPFAGFFIVDLAIGNGVPAIMSQRDTEERGDAAVDQAPMGTGPYRFVSHAEDEDFVFERFEDHFLPVDHSREVPHYAHNKHLTVLVRPEVQSRLAGLEVGEIDTVQELGPDNVKPFVDDPDFTVQFQPADGWTIQVVYPNLFPETMADGSPNPFLDIRVRQAANHAINRQSIIDNLLLGQGEYPLFAFTGVNGYPTPEQKQEVQYDYDPERARQLLAEAGYADGFDIPLYWTHEHGGTYEAALVLAVTQDLTAVGIRAEPRSILAGDYFTDAHVTGGPDLPAGLYWFWANVVGDVGAMWDCCAGPESFFMRLNGEGIQDPALHELYLAQRIEQDPARRLEMITELFLEHARQAWLIFIVEAPDAVLTRSDVNWPKGGRYGRLWGATTFAIQRRI